MRSVKSATCVTVFAVSCTDTDVAVLVSWLAMLVGVAYMQLGRLQRTTRITLNQNLS